MKVLLFYPNLMMKHILSPAIGILTASLKREGFVVDLFDTTYYASGAENPDEKRKEYLQVRSYDVGSYGINIKENDVEEDFRKKVGQFKPDIIGVTAVEDTMSLALRLVRSLGPDRPKTIFGGIHISYLKEKAFLHDEIDMICVGEGEEALPELCRRLSKNEDLSGIKNIYMREGEGGTIERNPLRPLVDLETISAPDYSLFEEKRFYSPMQGAMRKMVPIDFDRGCPYNCNFCASPAYRDWYKGENGGVYFRKKSIKKIIEETEYLKKRHNPEYLYFNSDTFLNRSSSELEELLLSIKNKIHLPFWCQTRVETVTEDKMRLLKTCGCDRITIGLEHGNEKFRNNVVGKGFTNAQFIKAMGMINNSGLPVSVNNIIGFPNETRELVFDTIQLNRQVKSDSISVFIFYPYTGTRLHDFCLKNGLLEEKNDSSTLLGNSVVKNPFLSKERLNNLLRTFCLYVRFDKDRWKDIGKIENGLSGSEEIFRGLSDEYQKRYFAYAV